MSNRPCNVSMFSVRTSIILFILANSEGRLANLLNEIRQLRKNPQIPWSPSSPDCSQYKIHSQIRLSVVEKPSRFATSIQHCLFLQWRTEKLSDCHDIQHYLSYLTMRRNENVASSFLLSRYYWARMKRLFNHGTFERGWLHHLHESPDSYTSSSTSSIIWVLRIEAKRSLRRWVRRGWERG